MDKEVIDVKLLQLSEEELTLYEKKLRDLMTKRLGKKEIIKQVVKALLYLHDNSKPMEDLESNVNVVKGGKKRKNK